MLMCVCTKLQYILLIIMCLCYNKDWLLDMSIGHNAAIVYLSVRLLLDMSYGHNAAIVCLSVCLSACP